MKVLHIMNSLGEQIARQLSQEKTFGIKITVSDTKEFMIISERSHRGQIRNSFDLICSLQTKETNSINLILTCSGEHFVDLSPIINNC